jgi:hypothetical protein
MSGAGTIGTLGPWLLPFTILKLVNVIGDKMDHPYYISDSERNQRLNTPVCQHNWMGVNQSSSWTETMLVAEKYLKEGKTVRIETVHFGEAKSDQESREHDPIEYEVWVDFR